MEMIGDILAYTLAFVACGAMLWRMLTDTDDKYPPLGVPIHPPDDPTQEIDQ